MRPLRFSVVIVTKGRPGLLRETLLSMTGLDPPPHEVLVVDGDAASSARPVVEALAGDLPAARYVASEPGITRQRNRGLAEVSGDVVVFFDDDVDVDGGVLAVLARGYQEAAVVGVTGRVFEPVSHRVGAKHSRIRRWLPGGGKDGNFTRYGYPRYLLDPESPTDVEFMQGCFMTARASLARELRFDEDLPGYGVAEDEDFSVRLSRRGRIRYLPDAILRHRKIGFGAQNPRRFSREVVVNRTYLFRKNFDPTLLARLQFGLLVLLMLSHRLLNRDWQGARGLVEGAVEAWRSRRSSP